METGRILEIVREQKPLIHHITNFVTMSECANITLAAGGLPIMAHAAEEVEEMMEHAQALVLNSGTLTPEQVEAMILAGRRANVLQRPVILDPVGAGATQLRIDCAKQLLQELNLAVIKGNAAEIAVLAGGIAKIRGVESIEVAGSIRSLAAALATDTGAVVAVTGPVDLITDGQRLLEVDNGHELMSKVVGTGCMTASVMACFAAVEPDTLQAAAAALAAINISGELAAEAASAPAAFRQALFDRLFTLDTDTIMQRQNVRKRVIE